MKTFRFPYLLVLLVLVSACSIGGNIAELSVARQAEGESVRVLLKENWYVYGELLSFEETSITILAESVNRHLANCDIEPKPLPVVATIAFDKIVSLHLIDINHTVFRGGDFFKYKNIEPQYFSRYPQNIDSEIMKNLLATYKQDSLWVL